MIDTPLVRIPHQSSEIFNFRGFFLTPRYSTVILSPFHLYIPYGDATNSSASRSIGRVGATLDAGMVANPASTDVKSW